MSYYNLIISRESAWEVMNQLGDLDCIHFIDADPTLPLLNRPFANSIKRYAKIKSNVHDSCDEALERIKYVE